MRLLLYQVRTVICIGASFYSFNMQLVLLFTRYVSTLDPPLPDTNQLLLVAAFPSRQVPAERC